MRAAKPDLDAKEHGVVKALEGLGKHLRNIQIVEFSYGTTDLRLVVDRKDLEWWLEER